MRQSVVSSGMTISTLTDKGQTTVPQEVREGLKLKPRQRLAWSLQEDGSATVRPQGSALDLFGSLTSTKKFRGRAAEREAVSRAVAKHVTRKV
jgi:bifunctional DNA-binding transcriptional regulator/antitoxin component of YhaV-PrlF toxin-antitoxin module